LTKSDIVTEIYLDKNYINYCKKIAGKNLCDDLFQYVCEYLLKMDEVKLKELHSKNELRMYVARIIYCSINGNRSQFKKELLGKVKYDELVSDITDYSFPSETTTTDEVVTKINYIIKNETEKSIKVGQYPATVKLFEIYMELGDYKQVSKQTKIPYHTVRKLLGNFKAEIKSKI